MLALEENQGLDQNIPDWSCSLTNTCVLQLKNSGEFPNNPPHSHIYPRIQVLTYKLPAVTVYKGANSSLQLSPGPDLILPQNRPAMLIHKAVKQGLHSVLQKIPTVAVTNLDPHRALGWDPRYHIPQKSSLAHSWESAGSVFRPVLLIYRSMDWR